MPKIRLTKLAEEYDTPFEEALELVKDKLPKDQVTGKGKLTWIGEEGQKMIADGLMITEITPKYYKGQVIKECPNPRYNYVHSKEIGKKVPVLIPNRYRGQMTGKTIHFEAIEDNAGVSYRYIKL